MSEQRDGLGALASHWKAESKRIKELADKERSKSGRESLMAQSVRYWMCADELAAALAAHEAVEPSTEERAMASATDEWWKIESLDVIRHARTSEPHDDWNVWQNAIMGGLLRAYNRGRDEQAVAGNESVPQGLTGAAHEEGGGHERELLEARRSEVRQAPCAEWCNSEKGQRRGKCDCWKAVRIIDLEDQITKLHVAAPAGAASEAVGRLDLEEVTLIVKRNWVKRPEEACSCTMAYERITKELNAQLERATGAAGEGA